MFLSQRTSFLKVFRDSTSPANKTSYRYISSAFLVFVWLCFFRLKWHQWCLCCTNLKDYPNTEKFKRILKRHHKTCIQNMFKMSMHFQIFMLCFWRLAYDVSNVFCYKKSKKFVKLKFSFSFFIHKSSRNAKKCPVPWFAKHNRTIYT